MANIRKALYKIAKRTYNANDLEAHQKADEKIK